MARVAFEPIKTTTFTLIAAGAGSYVVVGSITANAWRAFKISNNTDADLFFSIDGSNDHMFVPMSGFTLYDCSTNAQNTQSSDGLDIGVQTQFWCRYVSGAPTVGNVYVEGPYSPGSN